VKAISAVHTSSHHLCRTDASVKMLVALALMPIVISRTTPLFSLITGGICLTVCVLFKVRLRILLIRFAKPLFLSELFFSLKLWGADRLLSGGFRSK
jgi:energy-coupling factor transporter transmembrane protein EcfT